MANFTATELLAVRSKIEASLAGKVNNNELRPGLIGALQAHIQSTPDLVSGGAGYIAGLKTSHGRPVNIPVLKQLTTTVDSARNCGATEVGDSALVTPSWTTISKGFKMNMLQFENNEIGWMADFEHNIREVFKHLHNNLETKAVTNLETNKSASNAGTLNTWFGALNQQNVSLANYNYFYSSIQAEMGQNSFVGPFMNVHMASGADQIGRLKNQGAGNSTNLQYALDNFVNFATNGISAPTASTSASYIFVPGTVGVVPWINGLSRTGYDTGVDIWTTIADPLIPGWTWELKMKKSCADNSGTLAGSEADAVGEFRISGEFAFVNAYTSTTDTGIYKYVQKNI